jgi:hypothetical protein
VNDVIIIVIIIYFNNVFNFFFTYIYFSPQSIYDIVLVY